MSPRNRHLLILGLVCFVFFIFGNGHLSLIGHDETFYAGTAKEMAQCGEWFTPRLFGQPQFEKPILLYWFLRAAGAALGYNSFSLRLFPALFATLGIAAVYLFGLLGFRNERKAFLSALILASSFLFVGLARTVFTDMLFSVLILMALLAFYWGYCRAERRTSSILLFFAFAGLAVLTKGPLGLLLPFLTVVSFLLLRGDLKAYLCSSILWGFLLFTLIAAPWYALMVARHGNQFTHEFFYNDHWRRLIEAEHVGNDTWYFYPVSMVGGMFPWSLCVIAGVIHAYGVIRRKQSPVLMFLGLYVLVVLLVFQVAHSKLVSYVFPAFPPLALMTGDFLAGYHSTGRNRRVLLIASIATGLLLMALIPILLVFVQKEYGVLTACGPSERILLLSTLIGCVGVGLGHLFLVSRGKVLKGSYVLAFTIPITLLTLGVLSARVEPYVSSKNICDSFSEQDTGPGVVLCSRMLARAVRYYTGCDVAVIAIGKGDYFSPHPIPLLTEEAQTDTFLRKQEATYCIVKNSDARRLERMTATDFCCTSLESVGNAEIMKIELIRSRGDRRCEVVCRATQHLN